MIMKKMAKTITSIQWNNNVLMEYNKNKLESING